MKLFRLLPLSALLLFLFFSPVFNAAAELPPAPGSKERCPVCGMFVAPYPNWLATISFVDGQRLYFDGPKDLFRYVLAPQSHKPGQGIEDVNEIWVTEYYMVRPVSALDVYFIGGSDVLGPMGQEMVPVLGLKPAESFMRDHGGTKIFRFNGRELVEVESQ